jgi:hypothetical protein
MEKGKRIEPKRSGAQRAGVQKMVRVSSVVCDPITAWRIRDVLASHPLLGGATAQIYVTAGHDYVVLEGWTLDEELSRLAYKLARQAAGNRPVKTRLQANHCANRSAQARDPINI